MRELKRHILDLRARLGDEEGGFSQTPIKLLSRTEDFGSGSGIHDEMRFATSAHRDAGSSITPPSPSLSPDTSRERDVDDGERANNPPPALNLASSDPNHPARHGASSISSLLATASTHRSDPIPKQRPQGSLQAADPTLFLPFPTPSPTSPFLTFHSTVPSTVATTIGSAEPSPFLAPLQNISLFGGVLNLDMTTSPVRPPERKQRSPPEMSMPPPRTEKRNMAPEEAANLLLAFSSPDTLHPSGSTPKTMAVIGRERRSMSEAEEFVLDGGLVKEDYKSRGKGMEVVGKTAREILRM